LSPATIHGLVWSPLGQEAIDEIEALHAKALAALPDPSLVRPETRAFFERILAGEGEVIGARENGRLVAYGILQFVLEVDDDPRSLASFDEAPIVKLAGAAVAPGWRGQGLQRELIRRRVARAAERGCLQLYATAAPGNVASWRNLLGCGFVIAALLRRYGGLLRYLLVSGETLAPRLGVCRAEILRLEDQHGQAAALAAGRRGIAAVQDAGGRPCLVFADRGEPHV
jgi:RimJ/RimL family protein N-acetyltransferase